MTSKSENRMTRGDRILGAIAKWGLIFALGLSLFVIYDNYDSWTKGEILAIGLCWGLGVGSQIMLWGVRHRDKNLPTEKDRAFYHHFMTHDDDGNRIVERRRRDA